METVPSSLPPLLPPDPASPLAAPAPPAPAGSAGPAALCGAQWTIAADGAEAVVVEVGGGLRAYRAGGVALIDEYDPGELPPGSAGKVLVPWPNRIRDGRYTFAGEPQQLGLTESVRHNAIHGLVCWVPWRCVAQSGESVTLEYTVPAQPGYPWPLLLRTRWSVGGGGLRAIHQATNLGGQPCPFGLGVHPYLRLGSAPVDDLVLRVPARSRVLVDGRMLPIGAAKVAGGEFDFTAPRRIGAVALDTAFGDVIPDPPPPPDPVSPPASDDPVGGPPAGGSSVVLSTRDGRAVPAGSAQAAAVTGVRVWADATFRWWQVFTSDTLTGERFRRAVAVEPMTCPPDAFRSGRDVLVLEPGQTWTGSWGISPIH